MEPSFVSFVGHVIGSNLVDLILALAAPTAFCGVALYLWARLGAALSGRDRDASPMPERR